MDKNSRKTTIFVSICSGLMSKNLLVFPNSFLDQAVKKFERVVLLVPASTKEYFEKEFKRDRVYIETVSDTIKASEKNNIVKRAFSFFYTYLLFLENARGLAWEGIYLNVRPKDTWSGRLSFPVKWLIGNTFGRSKWVRRLLVPALDRFIHRQKFYTDLFDKYKPNAVFTPNIENWQDICLIREARQHNVPSIGMPGSWDHFPKRYRPLHPDKLLVGTYTQKNEAVKYQSFDEQNIHIVGVPYYDAFKNKEAIKSREEFLNSVGLDPKKKTIFFSSEGEIAPDDPDVVDMLYKWIQDGKFNTSCQLFVRTYPAVESEKEKYGFLEGKPNAYVDWTENKMNKLANDAWYPVYDEVVHFINSMYHVDILINTYSSIAIEAAYFGKKTIGINFDGYKKRSLDKSIKRFARYIHLKNIIDTGAVSYANSAEDLFKLVDKQLQDRLDDSHIEVLRHKMCGPMDGRTAERIIGRISNLIDRNCNNQ